MLQKVLFNSTYLCLKVFSHWELQDKWTLLFPDDLWFYHRKMDRLFLYANGVKLIYALQKDVCILRRPLKKGNNEWIKHAEKLSEVEVIQ